MTFFLNPHRWRAELVALLDIIRERYSRVLSNYNWTVTRLLTRALQLNIFTIHLDGASVALHIKRKRTNITSTARAAAVTAEGEKSRFSYLFFLVCCASFYRSLLLVSVYTRNLMPSIIGVIIFLVYILFFSPISHHAMNA